MIAIRVTKPSARRSTPRLRKMRRYLPLLLALLALLGTATGQTATRELRARRAESEDRRKLEVADDGLKEKKMRRNDGDDMKDGDDDDEGSGESEYVQDNTEVAETPLPTTAAGDDTPEPKILSEEVAVKADPSKKRRKLDDTGDAQDAGDGTSVASESGSGSDASSPDASAESGSGSDASA